MMFIFGLTSWRGLRAAVEPKMDFVSPFAGGARSRDTKFILAANIRINVTNRPPPR